MMFGHAIALIKFPVPLASGVCTYSRIPEMRVGPWPLNVHNLALTHPCSHHSGESIGVAITPGMAIRTILRLGNRPVGKSRQTNIPHLEGSYLTRLTV